jgi:hypothetical protein
MLFLLIFLLLSSAVFLLFWLVALIIPSFRRESFVYLLFAFLSIGGLAALYYFNPDAKAVAGNVYNTVYNKVYKQSAAAGDRIVDAFTLKLKIPAEVEKILGRPDTPPKPGGTDGKWTIKSSGRQVAALQATYKNGLVEVTFIENKAARVWIRPKTSYFYPADTDKVFTALGIKPGIKPVLTTEHGADWFKNIPGLFNLHFNFTTGKITEIGIIFDEKYV